MKRLASLAVLASCATTAAPPVEAPPPIPRTVRGAAGDRDLRVMMAEVASAKACALIQGQFRALRDVHQRDTAAGVLWIRDCKLTNDGTKVAFELGGSGWTWADEQKKEAGAKFVVHQYVKFDVTAKLAGSFDIAYAPSTHVASVYFTPTAPPDVTMTTAGKLHVDRDGVWAELLGLVGSAVGENPDAKGADEAAKQGKHEMRDQLADGLSVTVDLCSGLSRMTLGRPPKGELGSADAGETRRVPIEMHDGGLMVFAPQLAPDGMSIDVDAQGPVHVGLACHAQAEAAAEAFVAGKSYTPQFLVEKDVTGKATLRVGAQRCLVSVIARAATPRDVTFDYARPAREIARSTGGPLIRCGKPATTARAGGLARSGISVILTL
jgi:hypothetical protein